MHKFIGQCNGCGEQFVEATIDINLSAAALVRDFFLIKQSVAGVSGNHFNFCSGRLEIVSSEVK